MQCNSIVSCYAMHGSIVSCYACYKVLPVLSWQFHHDIEWCHRLIWCHYVLAENRALLVSCTPLWFLRWVRRLQRSKDGERQTWGIPSSGRTPLHILLKGDTLGTLFWHFWAPWYGGWKHSQKPECHESSSQHPTRGDQSQLVGNHAHPSA